MNPDERAIGVDRCPVYDDATLYDGVNEIRSLVDLTFWLRRCREARGRGAGRVLEIGCGTGRLLVPALLAGYQVDGLDRSAAMLEAARERAAERGVIARLFEADCRDFDIGLRYALITIPYNALQHLHSNDEVLSFLGCVRRHLQDDGRLVIEVMQPDIALLDGAPDDEAPVAVLPDPHDSMAVLSVTERRQWCGFSQLARHTWLVRRDRVLVAELPVHLRCFFPQELDALLRLGGMRITRRWGDFDDGPPCEEGRVQLVEAADASHEARKQEKPRTPGYFERCS